MARSKSKHIRLKSKRAQDHKARLKRQKAAKVSATEKR